MKNLVFVFLVLFFLTFFSSSSFAEVTTRFDFSGQKFYVTCAKETDYDDTQKLSSYFSRQHDFKTGKTHVALMINLNPIDEKKPIPLVQFVKDGFAYRFPEDKDIRHGAFSSVIDPYISNTGGATVTVSKLHSSSAGASYKVNIVPGSTNPTNYYAGPTFYATIKSDGIDYFRKYKMKPLEVKFSDDLLLAINEGKEMLILIPYAKNLSAVEKFEFVKFYISKETLAEWKQVVNADINAEMKKLNL